jgi:hypothetical protein
VHEVLAARKPKASDDPLPSKHPRRFAALHPCPQRKWAR